MYGQPVSYFTRCSLGDVLLGMTKPRKEYCVKIRSLKLERLNSLQDLLSQLRQRYVILSLVCWYSLVDVRIMRFWALIFLLFFNIRILVTNFVSIKLHQLSVVPFLPMQFAMSSLFNYHSWVKLLTICFQYIFVPLGMQRRMGTYIGDLT